jgi:hypothetical protein
LHLLLPILGSSALLYQSRLNVGISEILIAQCAFSLSYLRSPVALGFEAQRKMTKMAGERIQVAFDKCETT